MAEPTTTTASLAAATVGAGVIGLYPVLGDWGIVALSAFAAALVQLGARDAKSDDLRAAVLSGIMLVVRIMAVSLALACAVAALLMSLVDLHLATPHLLAIVSFALGLADGNWRAIGSAIGNWALGLLPHARPGDGK